MDDKEVLVVNNEGGKGNPNHKPAGSSDGGQFTSGPESGGGALGNKFLDFLKAKKNIVSTYGFNDIATNNLKANLNIKNLEKSFNAGTEKARQVVGDFFKSTQTIIDKGDACYTPILHRIYLTNADLTGEGKHGGNYEVGEVFYHEVFHGIDDRYGRLTIDRKLSNGKTIQEVFHSEINENKYSWNWNLFNEVKKDYEAAIEEEMSKSFTPDQIKEYQEKSEYYRKALNDLNKNFDNNLFHYPSIQAYNEAFEKYKNDFRETKKEWKKINDVFLPARQKATHKYSCLSDFCSYIYRTGSGNKSICGGHPKAYWAKDNGNKAIKEMWAELGSMWARGKTDDIDRMRKYFPKTVASFEELVGNLDNIRKEKYGE